MPPPPPPTAFCLLLWDTNEKPSAGSPPFTLTYVNVARHGAHQAGNADKQHHPSHLLLLVF